MLQQGYGESLAEQQSPIGVTRCNVPVVEWFMALEISWEVESTRDKKYLVAPPQTDILAVGQLLEIENRREAYTALKSMIHTAMNEFK